MKIKGLKKAVGDYNRANEGGYYSPFYGTLMFDTSDGRIWTDEFYSLGHNSYNVYDSDSIVCLSRMMRDYGGLSVSMKNVKEFVADYFPGFEE